MGIFGWLRPEEEPDNTIIGEISDGDGHHVVFEIPAEDEGALRRMMRESQIQRESTGRQQNDGLSYHMEKAANNQEDLEPEEDDDSIDERDEQPATGGWWPFG